jgi:hypothetical protein
LFSPKAKTEPVSGRRKKKKITKGKVMLNVLNQTWNQMHQK